MAWRRRACTMAVVRWAIIARAYSRPPRTTLTAAVRRIGTASDSREAPRKTRARSQPGSARRPMPAMTWRRPRATVAAIRRRTPLVKLQRRRSRYMDLDFRRSLPQWQSRAARCPTRAVRLEGDYADDVSVVGVRTVSARAGAAFVRQFVRVIPVCPGPASCPGHGRIRRRIVALRP